MSHQAVRFHEFGKPLDVLRCEALDCSVSGEGSVLRPGEVRVGVEFTPINPADINYVMGNYGSRPGLPAIPGMEASGLVVETCSDRVSVGDRVIFVKRVGGWQSEVVCDDGGVVVVPDMVAEQASMLKVNPLTALLLLEDYVSLGAGDYVIQNAANSGVGQCVIQIAKLLGIRTINLVRREELIPDLLGIGADHVFLDDGDVVDKVREVCGENLPKIAFNAVGGDSALRLMDAVAEQGLHVTIGAMSMRSLKVPNKFLIFKRIQLHGLWVTKWMVENDAATVEAAYLRLAGWVAEGKLSQAVDSVYKPEDIQEAIRRVSGEGRKGKVLLDFR